ncbi:hypothetical protein HPB50_027685 [Hyalomma asiaticum]|nr:hypothetical protein HPB50_027685 [Hyalomma asiaticum]
MGVVVGWLLHRELHERANAAVTHIAFWRDVTMSLLQFKQKLTVLFDLGFTRGVRTGKLMPTTSSQRQQGRCAERTKNKTNQCQLCKKRVHKKYFAAYNTL